MIIILHGKDSFRKQLRLDKLKTQYLEPATEALNYAHAVNPELKDFISLVQTPAWGLSTKVIVIKDFTALENKSEDKEVEQITQVLSNLPESVLLIFDSDKVSGTIKLVKGLKKNPEIQFEEFKEFSQWDIKAPAAWLVKMSENSINMELAEHLVEHIGTEDSSQLYSELRRLQTLGREITSDLINKECKGKHDIFKFIKELATGKIVNANLELEKLIKEKEVHLGLVAAMSTMLSKYLKLKLSEQERMNKDDQAKLLGVSPGRLYHQKQEVASMSIARLESLLTKTLEVENKTKKGIMPLEKSLRILVNS
ncbi:MAG: hypothetical protein O3C63_07280 [Cyanobacteria bacterium]|nr:hypothetical protein [Cyanobacteriota bacterium]MDA1020961.1 hypothetical protein [Cyanobacteriota bacterium]